MVERKILLFWVAMVVLSGVMAWWGAEHLAPATNDTPAAPADGTAIFK